MGKKGLRSMESAAANSRLLLYDRDKERILSIADRPVVCHMYVRELT